LTSVLRQPVSAERRRELAGILALVSEDIGMSLLKVGVVYGVAQGLESAVISPRIVGESVGLHPVWILLALSLGGFFFGFVGLLIGVPLAVAVKLTDPHARVSGEALKKFERSPPPEQASQRHAQLATGIAHAVTAAMSREILAVPSSAAVHFHSKLDKRDTREGWSSVRADSAGVPYSALLYQRYVGGVWRQVQDAYSEVKGDAVLEYPLRDLLDEHDIPYHHTRPGVSGARETAERYGMSPGPDFVIPDESPTLVVESKVGEDGGTVRDKAARIKNMASAADDKGMRACALVDGKGWTERSAALLEVVVVTQGRTYTLSTLSHLLELPEVRALTRSDRPRSLNSADAASTTEPR